LSGGLRFFIETGSIMATVQAKPEQLKLQPKSIDRIDEKLMQPGKYEIHSGVIFTVTIYMKEREGRWVLMTGAGKDIEKHEITFRMWGFNEMIELRKLATSYDAQKRIHMIDNDLLNRYKIQRLMMSWTFDRDNSRLRIQHVNGILTDEGWTAFTMLQPNIASHIIDEMNKVYEYNG
jgi:hypothetical protein